MYVGVCYDLESANVHRRNRLLHFIIGFRSCPGLPERQQGAAIHLTTANLEVPLLGWYHLLLTTPSRARTRAGLAGTQSVWPFISSINKLENESRHYELCHGNICTRFRLQRFIISHSGVLSRTPVRLMKMMAGFLFNA